MSSLRRRTIVYDVSVLISVLHACARFAPALEAADIVVTNHSLLFCDLVADGGLLCRRSAIGWWMRPMEPKPEARRAFSLSLSAEDAARLASRVGADEASVTCSCVPSAVWWCPAWKRFFAVPPLPARRALRARPTLMLHGNSPLTSRTFCSSIRTKKEKATRSSSCGSIQMCVPAQRVCQVESYGRAMTEAAEKLVHVCQELVGYLEELEGAAEDPARDSIDRDGAQRPDERRRHHLGQGSGNVCLCGHFESPRKIASRKAGSAADQRGRSDERTLFGRTHSTVFVCHVGCGR